GGAAIAGCAARPLARPPTRPRGRPRGARPELPPPVRFAAGPGREQGEGLVRAHGMRRLASWRLPARTAPDGIPPDPGRRGTRGKPMRIPTDRLPRRARRGPRPGAARPPSRAGADTPG